MKKALIALFALAAASVANADLTAITFDTSSQLSWSDAHVGAEATNSAILYVIASSTDGGFSTTLPRTGEREEKLVG